MSDVAKRQERSEEQKEQEKTKKELNPEWSQDAQDERSLIHLSEPTRQLAIS